MTKSSENQPNWEDSDSWNEFEWEQALKYSDHLAARYFRMLERFGDLPDGEDFIAAKLGDQNFFELDEYRDYEEGLDEGNWDQLDLTKGGMERDAPETESIGPGDSLYFETVPVYQRMRQISLGWCNILASVLTQEDRFWGMKVLFYFGRLLSYLALCIGDGTLERVNGSIAFAKRALHQLNVILGELNEKKEMTPKYTAMFDLISTRLLETHDMIVAHLTDLRKRQEEED